MIASWLISAPLSDPKDDMQLALIVQLSIAMLAGELAGSLPITASWCVVIALLGPLLVYAIGALLARWAARAMDQRRALIADRFFGFCSRAHWIASVCILIAASGDLATAWLPVVGIAGIAGFLVSCGIATSLVSSWNAWLLEQRIRESAIMRALDSASTLHAMPSRGAYVLAQARASLAPILAPLIVPVLMSQIGFVIAVKYAPAFTEQAQIAGAVVGTALLLLLVPVIIPRLLGLRRLEAGEMRSDLEDLARDARVGMSEIWVWPTNGLIANAAVMGIIPGLRCVMLSDALLECMPREQVRAVMAHELGHVVHRHLLWLIVVVIACWSLAAIVMNALALEAFTQYAANIQSQDMVETAHSFSLARDGAVLIAGLCAFGFASRRCERQADTFAVQLLSTRAGSRDATVASVEAMVGALGSVALLNHVRPTRSSWRHGSIAWRQAYLRTLSGRAHAALGIDLFVRVMCWSSLALVAWLLLNSIIDWTGGATLN